MANYRFLIQYEGSRYAGWQKLSGKEQTIQGKLEAVLEKMTGEAVAVIGSGRGCIPKAVCIRIRKGMAEAEDREEAKRKDLAGT